MVTANNWLVTESGDNEPTSDFQLKTVEENPRTFNFANKVFKGMVLVPTAGANVRVHDRPGREPRVEFLNQKARGATLTGIYIVEEHAVFRREALPIRDLDTDEDTGLTQPGRRLRVSPARQDLLLPLVTWMENGVLVNIIRYGLIDGNFTGSWLIRNLPPPNVMQHWGPASLLVRFNIDLVRARLT